MELAVHPLRRIDSRHDDEIAHALSLQPRQQILPKRVAIGLHY